MTDHDEGDLGIYAPLQDGPGGLHIEAQKVRHASRVHLDIETDDIQPEVARREALGATRVEYSRNRWWVMQAPTRHRFCVMPMPEYSARGNPDGWK